MERGENIVKVFFPFYEIKNSDIIVQGNVIHGYISLKHKHVYVVNNFDKLNSKKLMFTKQGETDAKQMKIGLSFMIDDHVKEHRLPSHQEENMILTVRISDHRVPQCILNTAILQALNVDESIIILYDAQSLRTTYYLSGTFNQHGVLSPLLKCISSSNSKTSNKSGNNSFTAFESSNNKLKAILGNSFCFSLKSATTFITSIKTPHMGKLCFRPAVYEQVKRKYSDCLLTLCRQQHKSRIHAIQKKNIIWRNGLDVVLGLLLLFLFTSNVNYSSLLANNMMKIAQITATELQNLLVWMMGAPAGLKLNSQMAEFLGKFFLYHIYLWTAYLGLLKPILSSALWYIAFSGWLGMSIQLALIQDLLSMMTLHIYCFYVYAARLYSFLVTGLSSLWRFFRGKKWNTLRQRVDSAQYNVDQLFIGTLLFTVLLFLLPTAALFYVVFLSFRLVVLLIQGSLYKVISLLNDIPVYILLLKIFNPGALINDVEFHVVRKNAASPYLVMQMKSATLQQIFSDGKMKNKVKKNSWGSFISNIVTGSLVYPWLDRS